ncbi:MAG: ATP synthase subunit I [Terriglobales bacterium]
MPSEEPNPTFEPSPQAEAFYAGAIGRITRYMPGLGVIFTILCWWRFGWRVAVGFIIGCLIAYLNFHWLKRVVTAVADRATRSGPKEGGRGTFLRFLLRYAFIAVAAYGILRVSKESLYGMLAGLFLPVAAIVCEAAFEVYVALRRGF